MNKSEQRFDSLIGFCFSPLDGISKLKQGHSLIAGALFMPAGFAAAMLFAFLSPFVMVLMCFVYWEEL